jgi:hypothetical protein
MTTIFWRETAQVRRTCISCGQEWVIGQGCCPDCRCTIFEEWGAPPKDAEKPQPPTEVRGWS